jgi:hypothetical protein
MSRDYDEVPDSRRQWSSSGGSGIVLLLLGFGLVVVLGVGGGVAWFMLRSTQQAERVARMKAEEAMARSDQATADALARQEQASPIPVDLSTIALERAEKLDGRTVLATYALLDNDNGRGDFIVSSDVGRDDDEDNSVERSVWVPKGKRVPMRGTAVGTLRVIRHPVAVGADGTVFPAWTEVRVVLDR